MALMDCCRVYFKVAPKGGEQVSKDKDAEYKPQLTIVFASKRGEQAFVTKKESGLSDMTEHFINFIGDVKSQKNISQRIIMFPTDYIVHNSYIR